MCVTSSVRWCICRRVGLASWGRRSAAHALRIGRGIVVLLCLGLSAPPCAISSAHAQAASTPPAELSAHVEYDAPASCPDRGSFETRLDARTKGLVLAPAGQASQL